MKKNASDYYFALMGPKKDLDGCERPGGKSKRKWGKGLPPVERGIWEGMAGGGGGLGFFGVMHFYIQELGGQGRLFYNSRSHGF